MHTGEGWRGGCQVTGDIRATRNVAADMPALRERGTDVERVESAPSIQATAALNVEDAFEQCQTIRRHNASMFMIGSGAQFWAERSSSGTRWGGGKLKRSD